MERVYVSGSTSFISTYVQRALVDFGYQVKALNRSFVDEPDQIDVDEKCLDGAILLYFGWYSNREDDYQHSVANFLWLERATKAIVFAKKRGMKIVIPGSSAEYLNSSNSPYAQSKRRLLDRLTESEIDFLWPRIFYAFSIEDLRPRIVRQASKSDESRRSLTLRSTYDAQDYVDVKDVALQIAKALNLRISGEIDIGSGQIHKTYDLVKRAFPKLSIVVTEEIPSDVPRYSIPTASVNPKLFDYSKSYTFQFFKG